MVKNLPANTGDTGDVGLIPEWGRSLEKEMAICSSILAWKSHGQRSLATVHRIAKGRTWLSYWAHMCLVLYLHCLKNKTELLLHQMVTPTMRRLWKATAEKIWWDWSLTHFTGFCKCKNKTKKKNGEKKFICAVYCIFIKDWFMNTIK